MQIVIYLKSYGQKEKGEKEIVENNVAFGLIEKGIAVLAKHFQKEIAQAPVDKMVRRGRKKININTK
jgi:hypothetical protein